MLGHINRESNSMAVAPFGFSDTAHPLAKSDIVRNSNEETKRSFETSSPCPLSRRASVTFRLLIKISPSLGWPAIKRSVVFPHPDGPRDNKEAGGIQCHTVDSSAPAKVLRHAN